MFGTNETGFPSKLLLTNRHVVNLDKDKKKDIEDNIISLSGFLGAFIGNLAEPLMNIAFSPAQNVVYQQA